MALAGLALGLSGRVGEAELPYTNPMLHERYLEIAGADPARLLRRSERRIAKEVATRPSFLAGLAAIYVSDVVRRRSSGRS
jgi:hypothetical protein